MKADYKAMLENLGTANNIRQGKEEELSRMLLDNQILTKRVKDQATSIETYKKEIEKLSHRLRTTEKEVDDLTIKQDSLSK